MTKADKAPTIFLSYAWKNKEHADEIDDHFKAMGITLIRDIRDVSYKISLKEFMQRIGETDYALMLINDEFLSSENCMYEVLELMRDRQFKKKILQVILPNAKVFDTKYKIDKIKYWQDEKQTLENQSGKIDRKYAVGITEELKHYENICL